MTDITSEMKRIEAVCEDNAASSCNHKMALDFVLQIATAALAAAPAVGGEALLERLKDRADPYAGSNLDHELIQEAVDEIERLSALAAAPALGPCTQAELDAAAFDSKQSRLIEMWMERALKAEAAAPAVGGERATSASPCLNCGDPSDELFCGTCREMGCTIPATPAVGGEALDRAAFQLFLLYNNASRWPSVNQEHYRKEAKSILDAAQPASPLRGRDEVWRIIVDIMASHLGHSYPKLADDIADALSSVPPEKPAADSWMQQEWDEMSKGADIDAPREDTETTRLVDSKHGMDR
jgi:hypothetical protein